MATGRTELVRVDQELIDALLAEEPERQVYPDFTEGHQEILKNMVDNFEDPEEVEDTRAHLARSAALFKAAYDREMDIIKQYKEKGYAMVELELQDDDDNGS